MTRLIATRDRERCLLIVSLSDQTLIAHCGQAPPVIGRTAVAVVGWRIVPYFSSAQARSRLLS